MKISELAKLSGVNSKAVRYYEEIGLLPIASRTENGYREYGESDIERLIFIRRCRELQIPIKDLKTLVRVQSDKSASCAEVDQIIESQLDEVRNRIKELKQLERTLNELAHSCRFDTVPECRILRKLGS